VEAMRQASKFFRDKGYQSRPTQVHGIDLVTDKPHVVAEHVAAEKFEEVLKPGMVIMAEPNPITADGMFGIFLGHTFIVTENGHEVVDKFPLEIAVAGKFPLTAKTQNRIPRRRRESARRRVWHSRVAEFAACARPPARAFAARRRRAEARCAAASPIAGCGRRCAPARAARPRRHRGGPGARWCQRRCRSCARRKCGSCP